MAEESESRNRITFYLSKIPGVAYAAEVGSRVRGTSTEHSDYDVFVIVARHPTEYLSISPPQEAQEMKWYVGETKMDVVVWDIYKAMRLFSRSNVGIIDALLSPLVYIDAGIGEELRHLLDKGFYSPNAIIAHCLGMARKATVERNRSPKRLLASIYSVLRARWTEITKEIPPLDINKLDPRTLYNSAELSELVQYLQNAVRNRVDEVPQHYVLFGTKFIDGEFQRLRYLRPERNSPAVPLSLLDEVLLSLFARLYPETKECFSRLVVR